MVCKEDVVSWFKNLKSHSRIDVMCSLLNLCLPFELRFLGTCLEDLGKRDFHELRKHETGANNPLEISSKDLSSISDQRARTKLALYISLLHSCNYACSNAYYKILNNVEEVSSLIKCNGVSSADDDVLEELLLIYTVALNHPAFTFEQKMFLTEVFLKLQQEEERRQTVKKTSPRSSHGLSGAEIVDKLPMQAYQGCSSPDQVATHPPVNSISPAALTGDPLVSGVHDLMGYIPYSMMPGYYHHAMMLPPPPAEQRSPIVSRTNSPCQSNSPSRAGSPGRPKNLPQTFNRPPPTVDSPHFKPSMDQLKRLTDEELRDQGFDNQSICQFRSLEKVSNTNGFCVGGKKPQTHEPEPRNDGGPLKRYNSAEGPLNPPPLYLPWPAINSPPCSLCVYPGVQRFARPHPNHLACHIKSLSLDRDCSLHNSSTSDSASDHSPPDTPGLSTAADRGAVHGAAEGWEEQRLSEQEERRLAGGPGRASGRGLGRSQRSTPPGIQTLPRGRGHNPPHRRRDTNSANGTMEERKLFSASDGGGVVFPYPAPLFPPNPSFIHTYPSFSQGGVFRLPFHHPNGDIMYQPLPPTGQPFLPARPAPPAHLPFSPPFPPPKICCYNCGSQNHIGTDCPEANIEEITNKGQYRIDYSNAVNTNARTGGDCTAQDK